MKLHCMSKHREMNASREESLAIRLFRGKDVIIKCSDKRKSLVAMKKESISRKP